MCVCVCVCAPASVAANDGILHELFIITFASFISFLAPVSFCSSGTEVESVCVCVCVFVCSCCCSKEHWDS